MLCWEVGNINVQHLYLYNCWQSNHTVFSMFRNTYIQRALQVVNEIGEKVIREKAALNTTSCLKGQPKYVYLSHI